MRILCDIDGCIANPCKQVKEYLLKDNKWDWKEYYKHTLEILPIPSMIELVEGLIYDSNEVIFVTGRPASDRRITRKWLTENLVGISREVTPLVLKTRRKEDTRNTWELKLRWCRELKPDLVIEDEPRTALVLEAEGFTVLQVRGYRVTEMDGNPSKGAQVV